MSRPSLLPRHVSATSRRRLPNHCRLPCLLSCLPKPNETTLPSCLPVPSSSLSSCPFLSCPPLCLSPTHTHKHKPRVSRGEVAKARSIGGKMLSKAGKQPGVPQGIARPHMPTLQAHAARKRTATPHTMPQINQSPRQMHTQQAVSTNHGLLMQ